MYDASTESPKAPMVHRILVVDASPFNRKYLTSFLGHYGYDVTTAAGGARALDLMQRKDPFDLVLLDPDVPDMDGLTVLTRLREDYGAVELPVIVLTSENHTNKMVACLRAGANDYISRPVDMTVTLARVKSQLRLKDQASARTGDLRKLSGEVRAITRPQRFYCPECLRAQSNPLAVACPGCQLTKPKRGWESTRDSPWPYLGKTLGGRYRLEQFIDKGAGGEVYKAVDVDLGREFAIKLINLANMSARDGRAANRHRVLREIEALVRLKNPHTVRIYQVLEVREGLWALVMEFCQGQTLEELLYAQGRLEPWLALDVTHQICSALHEAHSRGILHRDIKPANIMLEQMTTGEHFARVLDFGLVLMLNHPTSEQPQRCGTPEYVSPETLNLTGASVDARADIYSLGATLYHMLTGYPPFDGDDTRAILLQHISAPVPPLPRGLMSDGVTREVERLLKRMMAKDPDARYPDVETLLAELSLLTSKALSDNN